MRAAEGSTLAKLSGSQLGELVTFTAAQFSQKQEQEADKYGFQFSVKHGFSPYATGNSLNKLAGLPKGVKASTVQKMFSSHPDSEKRAARMKEKAANARVAAQQQQKLHRIIRAPGTGSHRESPHSYPVANAANNLSAAQLRKSRGNPRLLPFILSAEPQAGHL